MCVVIPLYHKALLIYVAAKNFEQQSLAYLCTGLKIKKIKKYFIDIQQLAFIYDIFFVNLFLFRKNWG
ncbi:hypothetical protein AGMMS49965_22590 [Bacteroidia bacterium]|nr:hypothetical protein AGMMS49965_22590 [Bacteroidia bacterium]